MAIQGVIKGRDVLRHSVLIISSFGLPAYVRCCKALLRRRPTTFLSCVLS
jgi:hypothetical protein